MLITVLIVLAALVIVARLRIRRSAEASKLGWMSERWLAEHRAGRSS